VHGQRIERQPHGLAVIEVAFGHESSLRRLQIGDQLMVIRREALQQPLDTFDAPVILLQRLRIDLCLSQRRFEKALAEL
jgi:hypothetical protein